MTAGPVLVLTTFPDADAAATFARTLVAERLAACVNILPAMQSIYRWKGETEEAREHQLLIKTSVGRLDSLKRRLRELHPYEVPELLVMEVQVAEPYGRWLLDSVASDQESA